MSYQYDLAGNRTRTTSANQVVSYGFDALNRLRTVRTGTPANPPTASTPAHEYEYAQLPAVASLRSDLRTAEVRPNGTRDHHQMHMVGHQRKGIYADPEDFGEQPNPAFDQRTAMIEAPIAEAILAQQPRPPNTARHDMRVDGVAGRDQRGAGLGHRRRVTGRRGIALSAVDARTGATESSRRVGPVLQPRPQ